MATPPYYLGDFDGLHERKGYCDTSSIKDKFQKEEHIDSCFLLKETKGHWIEL